MRIRAFTVSELNRYIKRIVTSDPILNSVTLKGEISNLNIHGSGHIYLSLKDEQSKINCVLFRKNGKELKFDLSNGMKVIVKGYISTFEKIGQYQLYIDEIQPDGVGDLYLAFNQLKSKLEREGLFHIGNKKKIPYFPKKVAIVTSPTGAAIQDIISVIKKKNNYVDIVIFPVLVQGENACKQISEAIDQINRYLDEIDVMIIGRGGGSIEELWAFNEEIVARSIANSQIPIISAVGHETDYTISDFVADLRAPTPSVAGELAVPSILDMKNTLDIFIDKISKSSLEYIEKQKNFMEKLDETKLTSFVVDKFNEERQTLDLLKKDLLNNTEKSMESYKGRLIKNGSKLETMNPLATMLRGYSISFKENENIPIDQIEKIDTGDNMKIMLTNGSVYCTVTGKEKEDNIFESFRSEIK